MLLAPTDFHINEPIRRHVGSYQTAYVSPAVTRQRQAEAERARHWERRTIVFGDPDWVEPRRRA